MTFEQPPANLADFLPRIPIFQRLEPSIAQALAAALKVQNLPAGATLFRQDDPGDAFYIIASGRLSIQQQMPDGDEVVIGEFGPGEHMGEMALLTGQPRAVTVTACEDVQLLRLAKVDFERLVDQYPALVAELLDSLLPRFQQVQTSLILANLFGRLDEALLRELQNKLEWRRLNCGEALCRQGEPGDEMYIVLQGRLRFAVEEAGQQRDLGEVGAGESIGEFALLAESGAPESLRSATVYATRLTDLVVITRPVFEGLLCQYPQALMRLTRRIVRRELLLSKAALPGASALVITALPCQPGLALDEFIQQLAGALAARGSTLAIDADRFEQMYGKPGASQTPLDHPTSLVIDAWLDERERQQQHVIYAASPTLDEMGNLTPWARRCVEDADVLLLVGEAGADPAPGAVEAALPAARSRARLELALLHADDCRAPENTAAWLARRRTGAFPPQAHHHVRLGQPADFRRLARRVSGCPTGLVLGGGGARGWAHIGAIQALEEANLEFDWVGGASMGAIIAASYALGWPVERLRQLAVRFSNPKKLLDYTFPYTSITKTRNITAMLQEVYADVQIEDTWRPYFCVSANLTRGEEQLHSSGSLWKAVRASMAFPAIFAPVSEDGCVLVDGGAANNLPVDRMRQFCPRGTVIGVDLVTSSPVSGSYDFGPSISGWRALLARLFPFARRLQAEHLPTLLDIVAGIVYSNSRYRLGEVRRCADLVVDVPVDQYGLLEFNRYAQIIELGYRATQEQIKGFSKK